MDYVNQGQGQSSKKLSPALLANLNTNFTSSILALTEIIAKFQPAPCRKVVVNISSGAAQKGYAGWSLYCAAKAGMEGFIRALAIEQQAELHPFIPINIDPGVIDTEMQALIRASTALDFPDVDRFVRRKGLGGLVAPSEVAAAVLRILDSSSLSYGGRYDASNTDAYPFHRADSLRQRGLGPLFILGQSRASSASRSCQTLGRRKRGRIWSLHSNRVDHFHVLGAATSHAQRARSRASQFPRTCAAL